MPTETVHIVELGQEEAQLLVQALRRRQGEEELAQRSAERRAELKEATRQVSSVLTDFAAGTAPEVGEIKLSAEALTSAFEAVMAEIRLTPDGDGQKLTTLRGLQSKLQAALEEFINSPPRREGETMAGNPSSGPRQPDARPSQDS